MPEQPRPKDLTTARSIAEVVQVAARSLVAAEFEITQSDAAGGTLTARKIREHGAGLDLVTCQAPNDSMVGRRIKTVLTVSLSAAPNATGSDVRIRSDVVASVPGMPNESREACASKGTIEAQIAEAVAK